MEGLLENASQNYEKQRQWVDLDEDEGVMVLYSTEISDDGFKDQPPRAAFKGTYNKLSIFLGEIFALPEEGLKTFKIPPEFTKKMLAPGEVMTAKFIIMAVVKEFQQFDQADFWYPQGTIFRWTDVFKANAAAYYDAVRASIPKEVTDQVLDCAFRGLLTKRRRTPPSEPKKSKIPKLGFV